MGRFLDRLKSGTDKVTALTATDVNAAKSDTITANSMFDKEQVDFQNADTLQKRTEDFIEEDLIRQFSMQAPKNPNNPKLKDLQADILKATGREFEPENLEGFLELTPEQMEFAKKIAIIDENKIFNAQDIAIIAKEVENRNIEKLKKLMEIDEKTLAFAAEDYKNLSKLTDSQIDRAAELASIERNCGFNGEQLFLLAQIPKAELDEYFKKNPDFDVQKLNAESIAIEAYSDDKKRIYNVFSTRDKAFVETRTIEEGDEFLIETIENSKNNIKQVVKTSLYSNEVLEETIYRYNDKKQLVSVQTQKTSADLMTQNVSISKDGKHIPIQHAVHNQETGVFTVEKNFVSPDGTKTGYFYEETPDGLKVSNYKITDKNGNVLMDNRTTFQPVKGSSNKFISSVNGRVYEIEHTKDEISVTDKSTGEQAFIKLDKLLNGKPENIMRILKEIPGNYLMKMANSSITLENTQFDVGLWGNETKTLSLGVSSLFTGKSEELAVFMHEFGHFLDTPENSDEYGIISKDPELAKIYKQELENFKNNTTIKQQEYIDYFVGDNIENGRGEAIAESAMLLSVPYSWQRSMYLQQYFPKTIAKISQMISQTVNEHH